MHPVNTPFNRIICKWESKSPHASTSKDRPASQYCSRHVVHYPSHDIHSSTLPLRRLALEGELGLAVARHGAPGRLIRDIAVVADGRRLPGLVKGLEEEGVEAPVDQRAEARVVELLGVVEAALGRAVVGAV
jgi:hypothetical protein